MTLRTDHLPLIGCNLLWLLSCLRSYIQFRRGADRPAEVQAAILHRLVSRNRNSAFGRKWHFDSIHSYSDWQAALPVSEYEDYAGDIHRIMDGEQNVLTAEPVQLLEPTSGSSGASKLIPYTASLRNEFQHAINTWIADMFLSMPRLLQTQSYWSISPPVSTEHEASQIPVGFNADTDYLSPFSRRLMKHIMVIPPDFQSAGDFLSCQKDLGFISVWSPTFLDTLFHGDVSKTHAMSSVQLVSCWGDACSQQYFHLAHDYFPQAVIQPKGLLATEYFGTLPWFQLNHQSLLAYHSHFYEFLSNNGTVCLPEQLETGKAYTLIVTTGGGLYRYNTHDIVQLQGHFRKVPILRFLGRDNRISDYFGEKLHETFVENACRTAFLQSHIQPDFYTLAFDSDHYVLVWDGVPADLNELETHLEQELQHNFHYRNCRCLQQLAPSRCLHLPLARTRYESFCQSRGIKLGDIKSRPLFPDFPWRDLK